MGNNLFFYPFIFLFGLIVGSFLNSVIYRLSLPNFSWKKIIGPKERSYCPHCKHVLSWRDLIPILSFLDLKGKCRYCKKNISWQYPLVELATAILFILTIQKIAEDIPPEISGGMSSGGLFSGGFLNLCYLLIVACFLIVIFVYDLKHYIIPDEIVFPAIGIAFLYNIFYSYFILHASYFILNTLYSALGASAFFFAIFLISKGKWLGFGDVKLAFFMGLFLGFPNIIVALFLSYLIGAIIGLGLILAKKKGLKSEVPFGPFLVTGTFSAFFWGEKIISWYLHSFLL
jgi:prepilin signal peptidase PulO-like enzyme (type II secretory pathway)